MIPSAVAYAQLMGLPPQHGLYASLIPLLIYPLFGSSKQLIVGPDIAISLLIAAAIVPLSGGNPAYAVALASIIAVIAGSFLLLGSRMHLGALADLLSKPVLVGYMTGAALILMCSQADKLLGIHLIHGDFFPRLFELYNKLDSAHAPTLVAALILFGLVLITRKIYPKIPVALVIVTASLLGAYIFDLPSYGLVAIGSFPHNLPMPAFPMVKLADFKVLFPAALGIAMLTYTEAILLARSFAVKENQDISPQRELTGLGIADIVCGLFQGFSVTGSQSRTVVNVNSGGKTQISGFVAASMLVLFLVALTSFIAKLPVVALAVILVYGGWTLVEFKVMIKIYRRYQQSGIIAALTTLGVLVAGVIPGILVGVALSLFGLITRISRPTDAILSKLENDGFHDLGENPKETLPGFIAYRFYAPLLFTNCSYFQERVRDAVKKCPNLKCFLFDAQAITDMDVTAAETMSALLDELKLKGIRTEVCHANLPFRNALKRAKLLNKLGQSNLFGSVHECAMALGFESTSNK